MAMTSHRNMEKIQAQLFKTCPAKELHKYTLLFATYMYILDNRNYVYKSQNSLPILLGLSVSLHHSSSLSDTEKLMLIS